MHHLSTAQREFGRSKCPANVAIRVPDEAALGRKPVHPPRTTGQRGHDGYIRSGGERCNVLPTLLLASDPPRMQVRCHISPPNVK